MSTQSVLASAMLISAAVAAPGFLAKREGPDNCPPTRFEESAPQFGDQPYVADVGFYSDKDCSTKIGSYCLYAAQGTIDAGSGNYGCAAGGFPSETPFWGKIEDSPLDDIQLLFTRDQTCPPNGPGAVYASLIDNGGCVQFNLGGDQPGVSIFPHGGSGLAREIEERALVQKRDAKCSGFNIESQSPSESQSVQVSSIVDCINGAEAGCTIEVGSEHTESVSTSYSVTAGGGIEGIFEVSATFGMEYTESSTTSLQEGFTIPQGQKGYLSAYSSATLFKGTYTGCDSGDAEQPGQALVIKENGFTYSVILTSA